jgi:hypothetical protein
MANKPVQPRTVGPINYRPSEPGAPPPKMHPVKQRRVPVPLHKEEPRVIGPAAPRRVPVPPKEQEHELRTVARQKYPDDREKQDAFVYGTMRQQGWKPEHHSPWDGKTYRHWYFGKMKV